MVEAGSSAMPTSDECSPSMVPFRSFGDISEIKALSAPAVIAEKMEEGQLKEAQLQRVDLLVFDEGSFPQCIECGLRFRFLPQALSAN